MTDRQIESARRQGFREIAIDPISLLARSSDKKTVANRAVLVQRACEWIQRGESVVIHTCRGPDDSRRTAALERLGGKSGKAVAQWNESIGTMLGILLDDILKQCPVRRVVVCGGDTSMGVARTLGIESLEYVGYAIPGSPLCRVNAPGRAAHGCEMVFKGGQNGTDKVFTELLEGIRQFP